MSDRLDKVVGKFIRTKEIDARFSWMIEKLSEYVYFNIDKNRIEFTDKGKKLSMRKKIVAYALAKYIAYNLKLLGIADLAINLPYISLKELSEKLSVRPNIVGARIDELIGTFKQGLYIERVGRGLYKVKDPVKAIQFITGEKTTYIAVGGGDGGG